jgi:hypothetical protein
MILLENIGYDLRDGDGYQGSGGPALPQHGVPANLRRTTFDRS